MSVYLGTEKISVYTGGIATKPEEEKTVTAGTTPIEVIPSEGKLISKVTVNPTPTEEKAVTPTTEDLVVMPVEGKQLSQVTVQGDANFLEENIAEGVTIWGKTGTHQGGGVPGQYVWSKRESENSDIIGYIVGETESDYPDGGIQDGYYYKKANIIIDPKLIGKTWTLSNLTLLNSTKRIDRLRCCGGMWFALLDSFGMYYSEDGKSWTKSTYNYTIMDIKYHDGLFVACSIQDIRYSTDGITWTQSNITTGGLRKLFYANNIWIATNASGPTYYSNDGKNWSESNITSISIPYVDFDNICYGNNMFLIGCINGLIYYSTDGITWNSTTVSGISNFIRLYYNDGMFVFSSRSGIYYSTDGITWTQSNITTSVSNILSIDNIWYAKASNTNNIYYSIDGKNWATIDIGIFTGMFLYTDKLWIGIVSQDAIYYSEDLKTWVSTFDIDNKMIGPVLYDNDICVASLYTWSNDDSGSTIYNFYLYYSTS